MQSRQSKTVNILFLMVVLSAALYFFSDNAVDPDLWGHLRFGQNVWEQGKLEYQDTYSYAQTERLWINHEWIAECLQYAAWHIGGSAGLLFGKVAIGLIIAFLMWRMVSRQTTSLWLRFLFMIVPLSVISYGFATRPQIFTALCFTIMMWAMVRYEQTKKAVWLWVFPPLFLAWANLHGGFVAGIAVLGVFCLFHFRQWKSVWPIGLLALLLTLMNPYGIKLWIFLGESLANPRPYLYEWQPVRLILDYADYIALLILTLFALLAAKIKRIPWELVVLALIAWVSWQQNRHTVLFGIVVAFLVPKYIESCTGNWFRDLEQRLSARFFIPFFSACIILFMAKTCWLDKTKPLEIEIPAKDYPMQAIAFMASNNISGNLLCHFDWSQLCIRQLHGNIHVFFDGRFRTVYDDELIETYFDVLYRSIPHQEFLAQYPKTDLMLLHPQNTLDGYIAEDPEWIQLYKDDLSRLYVRDIPNQKELIKQHNAGQLINPEINPPFYFR